MKRIFDLFVSLPALAALAPFFIIIAILIKSCDSGPVFFRQERIGKDFEPFFIYKFRTMSIGAERKGPQITVDGDARITSIGRFLRKHKIDELPQLINVAKGEMSLVGPRPEVKKYVEMFRAEYGKLLKNPPGITDPASLSYSSEEGILALSRENWEDTYIRKVLPEKLRLSLQYAGANSILTDTKIILGTILRVFGIKRPL